MSTPPGRPRPRVGRRSTAQRATIVDVVHAAAGPLTVQDILERAQQRLPKLGVATVYRTLKLLLDAGEMRTVILPTGETRYESAGLGHHHHFHCRACDRVYDLSACPVSMPPGSLAGGFQVEDHELTLYGTCPACG